MLLVSLSFISIFLYSTFPTKLSNFIYYLFLIFNFIYYCIFFLNRRREVHLSTGSHLILLSVISSLELGFRFLLRCVPSSSLPKALCILVALSPFLWRIAKKKIITPVSFEPLVSFQMFVSFKP